MTKQILTKSLMAVVLTLMASTASNTFAQSGSSAPSTHTLSAGQNSGGGNPDPTGGGNGGNSGNLVAVH